MMFNYNFHYIFKIDNDSPFICVYYISYLIFVEFWE